MKLTRHDSLSLRRFLLAVDGAFQQALFEGALRLVAAPLIVFVAIGAVSDGVAVVALARDAGAKLPWCVVRVAPQSTAPNAAHARQQQQ